MRLLCTDLVVEISDYSLNTEFKLLNKEIHCTIYRMMRRNNRLWRKKYEKHFNDLDLNFLILKDNTTHKYLWRQELARVIEFNKWNLFKRMETLQVLDLSQNNLREIPKEVGNLINLRELRIDICHLKNIPKELANLTNLHRIETTNQIRMPTVATGPYGPMGSTGAMGATGATGAMGPYGLYWCQ